MMAQLFLFPFVVRRFGNLKTFRFVVMSWPLLYFLTPYLILLPPKFRMAGVYFCLCWKITAQVLAFPSNAILLTNSAPSMLVLGVINGIAASTASLSRTFGPTVSGFIHTWGLKMGCTGLVWWAAGLVCVVGAVESLWMAEVGGRMNQPVVRDEEVVTTEVLVHPLGIGAVITAGGGPNDGCLEDMSESFKPKPAVYCDETER